MTGPHDGKKLKYVFGNIGGGSKHWDIETTSLAKATRAFRVGAMYPHQYSTKPIPTAYGDDWDQKIYLSSEPGSTIPVDVYVGRDRVRVADISPEGSEDEYGPTLLAAQKHLQVASESMGLDALDALDAPETTTLALAGSQTGMASSSRRVLEEKTFELHKRMAELEDAKRELMFQVGQMKAELARRVEQVWMIELLLGSKEEVKLLRTGEPAPVDTPITVRQQVLCMDEEIAIFDWFDNPERIGEFDYNHLEDFDNWLIKDVSHLNAIFPHPKGIVGLRVRRYPKSRGESQGYFGVAGAFRAMAEQEWDAMTYLLVRNGDNLYRLWVDVNMWPRMFAAAKDFEKVEYDFQVRENIRKRMDERETAAKQKKFFAGLLVIQGLIERSDLFHPLPIPNLSVVDPDHQEYFNLVRDGEEFLMLADTTNNFAHLTWNTYNKWLHSQLEPGVRVLYTGERWFSHYDKYDSYERRTGLRTIGTAPQHNKVYTLVEPGEGWRVPTRGDFQFMYLPNEEVNRKKRIRWGCSKDELLPVDMISWRVLEFLLRDRNHRHEYGEFFTTAFHWWKQKRAETELEKPFVDLVLAQAGADPTEENRARAERLTRWWKMKTKTHRTLSDDESKALRMVIKAFKRGDDHDNDPERLLFRKG